MKKPNTLLREARLAQKWSQSQLAEKVGVTTQAVRTWELGTRFPLLDSRDRLCDIFQMTPEQLGLQPSDLAEQIDKKPASATPAPADPAVAVRRWMLQRVRTIWIEGVQRHSLRQAALITLDLQEQPDAVANPWRQEVQEMNLPSHPLPPGTSIEQVYDQATGELLILGDPGAGKTTLLLELANRLLDRADQEPGHPLPVVFMLSSWAAKQQPLADWLVEELHVKYQVPRQVGQQWIDTHQILPLLDGLDEVAETIRPVVRAINVYKEQHEFVPLVVCRRSEDCYAATTQIVLRIAILVQPLTTDQINTYLFVAGSRLDAVRKAFAEDPELLAMSRTPLMLSIVTLAYEGASRTPAAPAGSVEARRQQIFAVYIQRMLGRRGAEARYTATQTIHWLAWLARQLESRSQAEFYLERVQPDWLPDQRSRELHRHTVIRVVYGSTYLILAGILGVFRGGTGIRGNGIGNGLLGWLGAGPGNTILGWMAIGLGSGISGGGIVSLIFGIVAILVGVLVSSAYGEVRGIKKQWSGKLLFQSVARGLFSGLIATFLIGAFTGLLFGLKGGIRVGWSYAEPVGLVSGLNIGLLAGLFTFRTPRVFRTPRMGKQKQTSAPLPPAGGRYRWNPKKSRLRPDHRKKPQLRSRSEKYLADSLIIGVGGGLCFALTNIWVASPSQGLLYGAAVGLFGGLLFRWDRQTGGDLTQMLGIEIRPAETMTWSWKSVKQEFWSNCARSVSIGLAILASVALVIGGASVWFGGWSYGIAYGVVYGLIVGMTVAIASILLGILNSGWSSDVIDEHQLARPNEGVRRSLRNSLFAALLFGPLGGLASGTVVGLAFGLVARLPGWPVLGGGYALVFGVVFCINFWQLYGGTACIEHLALRYRLWRARYIPWNYVAFLDYAAERILSERWEVAICLSTASASISPHLSLFLLPRPPKKKHSQEGLQTAKENQRERKSPV